MAQRIKEWLDSYQVTETAEIFYGKASFWQIIPCAFTRGYNQIKRLHVFLKLPMYFNTVGQNLPSVIPLENHSFHGL